jgi:hypothetical protein
MRTRTPDRTNALAAIAAFTVLLSCELAFPEPQAHVVKKAKGYAGTIRVHILKRVPLPRGYHEGLYLDGKNIWVANGKRGKVWVFDSISGSRLADIEPPATFTEGITARPGGGLFVTDWDERKLYGVRIEKGRMIQESEVSLGTAYPAGILWNGSSLFVVTWTRSYLGTRFDLLEMDEHGAVRRVIRIGCVQEPAHLAWDGEYLWITSWYNSRVYKVDVRTWHAVGSFRSPIPKATGIAWDGQHLWLTGTYEDLYQLDVGK